MKVGYKMSAPALEFGLDFLDYLLINQPCGFNDIKSEFSLSPASLTRYLKVLVEKGYIQKNEKGQYILNTSKSILKAEETTELEQYMQLSIEKLSEKLEMTVFFIEYRNGKMICKNKVIHPLAPGMQDVGEIRTDYHVNPWGMIFLAHCTQMQKDFYLSHAYTKDEKIITMPTMDEIQHYIEDYLKSGYILDSGKIFKHLNRVAVPVFDCKNRLIGSVVAASISSRMDLSKTKEFVEMIQGEIKEIIQLI